MKIIVPRRNLDSYKYSLFTYKRTTKEYKNSRGIKFQYRVYDVFYNESFIIQLENLKQVKEFIREKANT